MFHDAQSFNQPLNNWNVSKVRYMNWMFENARSFNQPLNKWNVSNVTNMRRMFLRQARREVERKNTNCSGSEKKQTKARQHAFYEKCIIHEP